MGDWKDKLEAQGRGAAQTLTGGWNDEIVARLIKHMSPDDGTGIPREYAGGQYEQYRNEQRADEAQSQQKYPANFATGQIAGALPGTLATMAMGGLPAVGLAAASGAASGAGLSTASGRELAKDTIRGAAVGGGLAAGGNALQAAAPAMKALWRQGPPSGGLRPALAGAAPKTSATLTPPHLNFDKSSLPQEVAKSPSGARLKPMDAAQEKLALFDNQPPRQLGDFQKPGVTREVDPAALESARQKLAAMDPGAHLGKGWARSVYDVEGQAQKVATGPRGILQNEAEVNTWNKVPAELRKNSVLNPVLSHAPDYSSVNQRLVEPLDLESMAVHTKMDPETIPEQLKQMAEPDFQGPWPSAEGQELQERMRRAFEEAPELDYRDVGKATQWGLDKRGKPVLIDYGFLKGMPLAVAGGAAAASQNR